MARATRVDRGTRYPADALTTLATDVIYKSAGGIENKAVADANTTYSAADGICAAQYLCLTGTLTAARTYVLTRDEGAPLFFLVENATSGGFSVIIKTTSGGTGVTVGNGKVKILVCTDATNVRDVNALF